MEAYIPHSFSQPKLSKPQPVLVLYIFYFFYLYHVGFSRESMG
ncbi:hypothetical protein E2C01_018864 [Portunus trituberculatus]|uniref:Uncharacterized protein n=1 Tax=Portunus trituberculatus TaxID=210409 RepID=A0A5B7DVP9_PORTR|nr:hypothetical protein [Portunus trituberculatus]